jgi:hypothetical protein
MKSNLNVVVNYSIVKKIDACGLPDQLVLR